MDKLEQFITENKESFNQARDPESGWGELAKRLDHKQPDWSVYWKVAAIVFFMSTIALIMLQFSDNSPKNAVLVNEVDRFEKFYINQISLRMDEYGALVDPSEREALFRDLAAFDSAYVELSVSFERMKKQELAEAMLENLRLRILILSEQIELVKNGGGGETSFHSS